MPKKSTLKNTIIKYLFPFIKIGFLIGMIFVIRWLGFKGVLGILIGISVTTWLFMSKNPMLLYLTHMGKPENEFYIDELNKK